jgi:phenylpropionate dioxygenase-like ring-hydroxylating dioxygenase large terminal subunit
MTTREEDENMQVLEQLLKNREVRSILAQDLASSAQDVETAITLPPECYTSEAWLEYEKEVIFRREWLCLGRSEQIPNIGDYFTTTVIDEPLIVVRAEDDSVHVMSSVCRHRAMLVTASVDSVPQDWGKPPRETQGNCRVFKCPYHFWSYDLDGQLVGAPEMTKTPGFEKSEIQLPRFRTEVWNGFIFVNFDPDARPLAPRLQRFSEWLENWNLADMVMGDQGEQDNMPWNWKVMHENSIEPYHSDRLHFGLHDSVPSSGVVPTSWDEDEAVIALRNKAKFRDFSLNPTYKALLPVIDTLTDEQREETVFGCIAPTLLLGVNTDSALYRIVYPTGPGSISMRFGNLFPRSQGNSRRVQEIRRMTTQGLLVMTSQDFPADTAVQVGLKSRYAPRSRYSWQEEPLGRFNRWLVRRYLDGAAGAPGEAQ